ncbi:endopeptidase La [Spiroplasma endosymbiont of Aspidapion aeneum]|uniref:endopeptidase La n=1 Tax=Spiroplasma endosymbiont of Aspidapion aeneum TaxID=3066276 RepID=UPI00313EA882
MAAKKNKLPLLVTRGSYIFPKFKQTLEIGREVSRNAIKSSQEKYEGLALITSQKKPIDDEPKIDEIYNFGVLAKIKINKEWSDGTLTIELESLKRVKLSAIFLENLYWAKYEEIDFKPEDDKNLAKETVKRIRGLIKTQEEFPSELESTLLKDIDPQFLVDTVTHLMPFMDIETKQKTLEEIDPLKRLDIIEGFLNTKKQSAIIDATISKKIKTKIDDSQREFYLKEKMKAIKEELGEMDSENDDIKKYKQRLETEPFPENIKKRVLQEIERYESIPAASSESVVTRTYIDWLMQVPWWETSEKEVDLENARKIFDKHHYGLEKVKERIIEYLAVKKNTKSIKGQIITLVGPPGVGKTSLGKAIAEAMGRKFVKVSLGGVRDEAEIRGHRKTYIGSLPGRIIQGMKKAGVTDPVFLLDEVDKMASDYKGDPASAMLEVLDPEQNSKFSDHYLEEEYDLSSVMFIATANYPDQIPAALYDRMEIIELSSYTEIEKLKIAQDYLIPKVFDNYNLTNTQLTFTKESIEEIIKHYTREAGVRQLERLISTIARKFIVKMLNGEMTKLKVTIAIVNEYLKKRVFEHTDQEEKAQVGVVTGLAYTQFGGDILPIECNHFPGKGGLIMTGKLGDVMKESASIAYDFVKSNHKAFGIPKEVFFENDIHIHVPEGAVPKDGPSAGVTITTSIISALTNKKVPKEIGMTGEITLRGLVFPIGGLREKSISAHRSGLKKILVPAKNEKDLDEIPEEVKKDLEIVYCSKYEQVYEQVFGEKLNNLKTSLPAFTVEKTSKKKELN